MNPSKYLSRILILGSSFASSMALGQIVTIEGEVIDWQTKRGVDQAIVTMVSADPSRTVKPTQTANGRYVFSVYREVAQGARLEVRKQEYAKYPEIQAVELNTGRQRPIKLFPVPRNQTEAQDLAKVLLRAEGSDRQLAYSAAASMGGTTNKLLLDALSGQGNEVAVVEFKQAEASHGVRRRAGSDLAEQGLSSVFIVDSTSKPWQGIVKGNVQYGDQARKLADFKARYPQLKFEVTDYSMQAKK